MLKSIEDSYKRFPAPDEPIRRQGGNRVLAFQDRLGGVNEDELCVWHHKIDPNEMPILMPWAIPDSDSTGLGDVPSLPSSSGSRHASSRRAASLDSKGRLESVPEPEPVLLADADNSLAPWVPGSYETHSAPQLPPSN